MSVPNIVIIDGTSFIYRAFYAVKNLGNSHIATNAIYGFVSMIKTLQNRYVNTPMVCAFDAKGNNFRHEIYPEYKSHRPPPPPELITQIPYIYKIVQAFGIPIFSKNGLEADDIIGSLAKSYINFQQSLNSDCLVHILTGDKDFAQLVSPYLNLYNSMTSELLNETTVLSKFGVYADQIIDYLALIGDSADNIPGVLKCGPVTARKWLGKYGSLESIIANSDQITGAVGDNLRKVLDWLPTAKQLVTINCDLDLASINNININELTNNIANAKDLYQLFLELKFNRWLIELKQDLLIDNTEAQHTTTQLQSARFDNIEQFSSALSKVVSANQETSFNVIFDRYNDHQSSALILQLSYCQNSNIVTHVLSLNNVFFNSNQKQMVSNILLPAIKNYLFADINKISFHTKSVYYFLINDLGFTVDDLYQIKQLQDINVLAYIDDSENKFNLCQLINSFNYNQSDKLQQPVANMTVEANSELDDYFLVKTKYNQISSISTDNIIKVYTNTLFLYSTMLQKLSSEQIKLYLEIELPLVKILVQMEMIGIKIDVDSFSQIEQEIKEKIEKLVQEIYQLAGCVFNINSPKQLQDVLYNVMGITTVGISKNSNGYSTNEKSLHLLQKRGHDVANSLLEYRYLSKILNTYILTLPKMVDNNNRLHTTFEQTAVISGRLASKNPNLQNIPVKHFYGQKIRQSFIVEPGYELLKIDYSQIELRLLAYFSQDQNLLHAFAHNQDIHALTAMEIFHKTSVDQVSLEERRYAKTINFGIIYGQSAFSLAQELSISNQDAKEYIKRYFARFPQIQDFIYNTQQSALNTQSVQTLFGRKIYLKDINSNNHAVKQGQLRLAVNAILQGSAADIIKLAMVRIGNYLHKNNKKSALLLQIHDELIFQIYSLEAEEIAPIIKDFMVKDFPLHLEV